MENADRVTPSTDTSNYRLRKLAFLPQDLSSSFSAYDALEIICRKTPPHLVRGDYFFWGFGRGPKNFFDGGGGGGTEGQDR